MSTFAHHQRDILYSTNNHGPKKETNDIIHKTCTIIQNVFKTLFFKTGQIYTYLRSFSDGLINFASSDKEKIKRAKPFLSNTEDPRYQEKLQVCKTKIKYFLNFSSLHVFLGGCLHHVLTGMNTRRGDFDALK